MKILTIFLLAFENFCNFAGPFSKHNSTVSAKSGSSSKLSFSFTFLEHFSWKWQWIDFLFKNMDRECYVTRMCWQWTQTNPRYRVRNVPNKIPPFLNASPIANTPDPILPLRRCIKLSRYLQYWSISFCWNSENA